MLETVKQRIIRNRQSRTYATQE